MVVLLSAALAQVMEPQRELSNVTSSPQEEDESPKLPSEVQKAVCTVTAGEVKASAEAVTTKTLKGVCGSDEMQLAFRNLESKLYEELRVMKLILVHLAKSSGLKVNTALPTPVPDAPRPPPTTNPFPLPFLRPIEATPSSFPGEEENEVTPDLGTNKVPMLKDLETQGNSDLGARDDEVDKFNNTMLADQNVKLFTYYWKLENVTQRINGPKLDTVTSPIFSIKGKSLQLKCTFHHMNRELLNLQLGYGVFSPEANNIMLEMGGIFQKFKWAEDVLLKHKISILDQSHSHRRSQDLSSQELTKLDTGFSIPNSVLLDSSTYIKQDALLIQILLYL
ncbi:hypothetical protein KR038_005996 [Drosophila bunnanda]|nr:hypothetical protein KR038_005996 [Drosophila bunnanda]